MPNAELLKFADSNALADTAAKAWLDEIDRARQNEAPYSVALSGGRITHKFFSAVVAEAEKRKAAFGHVHFFWADERCVPPTDPESNFKMAEELLFAPLRIPDKNIHRLRGEDSPHAAVKIAEADLRSVARQNDRQQPILDLILLGMGEDGHVASLFPGLSAKIMDISVPFLVVENSPKPPPTRISMSYKLIFAAQSVWVLISGAGKEQALRNSLSPEGTTPLARVIQHRDVKIFSVINEF